MSWVKNKGGNWNSRRKQEEFAKKYPPLPREIEKVMVEEYLAKHGAVVCPPAFATVTGHHEY